MLRTVLFPFLAATAAVLVIAGCRSPSPSHIPVGPAPPPPGNPGSSAASPSRPDPVVSLTLSDALDLVRRRNPALAAAGHGVDTAHALTRQAGRLPNPELELEVEEFDRFGDGLDSAEASVRLVQRLELGGKRRWRSNTAEADASRAEWDRQAVRLEIEAETALRFLEVLAAQGRLDLAAAAEDLARDVIDTVEERVRAGKEPPFQAARAAAELDLARMAREDERAALEGRRFGLASLWGAPAPHFRTVDGDLAAIPSSLPPPGSLPDRLAGNPGLAGRDADIRKQQAVLGAARAARIVDLDAGVGYQRFEEDGSDALAFGVALPLPLFDRNQDTVRAAGYELARARAERRAEEDRLAASLAVAEAALRSAHHRVSALQSRVVPAMASTLEAARQGYQEGKFGALDMLDARRGLVEARTALLEAQVAYHGAAIEIQRLTADGPGAAAFPASETP